MGYYDLNVKFDNEDKRKSKNWKTQYASVYKAPPSDYRGDEAENGNPIAGVISSPFKSNFAKAHTKIPGRSDTQKEYFGITCPLDHKGEGDPRLRPASYIIGVGSQNTDSKLSKPKQREYAGIEVDRLLPSYKPIGKNDRTCWNRNASNVGNVVFKEPKVLRGRPGKLDSTSRSTDHFVTSRHADDARVRTHAAKIDAYNADNVRNHSGYSVRNRLMDDTTISGDSPSWMQIPGVNVSSLNSLQLQSLLTWSAPLPKNNVDPKLLGVFQIGDHEAPDFHPELAHLPKEKQQKFVPGPRRTPESFSNTRDNYGGAPMKPMSPMKNPTMSRPMSPGNFLQKGGGGAGVNNSYDLPDNYNSGFNLRETRARSIGGSTSSKAYSSIRSNANKNSWC